MSNDAGSVRQLIAAASTCQHQSVSKALLVGLRLLRTYWWWWLLLLLSMLAGSAAAPRRRTKPAIETTPTLLADSFRYQPNNK
jgi:hypothetical protein